MLIWSLILFGLGMLAFLDSQFNYGYIFRSANSILFMLVSLGVLIRSRYLSRQGTKEQLMQNNDELRARMINMKNSNEPNEKKQSTEKVAIGTRR